MFSYFKGTLAKATLLTATAIGLAFASQAQFTIKEERKMLDKADATFDDGDYSAALKQYQNLLQFVPNQPYAVFKAGICFLNLSQPEKGLATIKNARRLDPDANAYFYFWLARAFHLNQKIDSALYYYDRYTALSGADKNAFTDQAKVYIKQANQHKQMLTTADAKAFRMENLGANINSRYSESNMLISKDGTFMVFTSRRPAMNEKPMYDGEFASKVFFSAKQPDGKWGPAIPMPTLEDREFVEYTSLQLLDNDNLILVYRHTLTDGQLLVSERYQNKMLQPQRYNVGLSSSNLELDCYFTKEVDKAFFTKFPRRSLLTIYQAKKNANGAWASPTAMDAVVNAPDADQFSPFLTSNQKEFFFASRRTSGLGGSDIFKADYDAKTGMVSNVTNAGLPYNSAGDEVGYYEIYNNGQRESYIAAERNTCFGKTDIFKLVKLEYVTITGRATGAGGRPLANYTMAVTAWDFDDCDFLVKTDADGNYKLVNVIAGQDYKVAFIRDEATKDTLSIEAMPVPNITGKNTMVKDFAVVPSKFVVPAREISPADRPKK